MNPNTTTDPDEIEAQAAAIAQAKKEQLIAAGYDVSAMTKDDVSEALKPLMTDEEMRILGRAQVNKWVAITIGEKIVEILQASNFKVHLPDIVPSVTAYLEYLADDEAGEEQAA